ncbi:ABC transporter ATP-binding protein [Janibacter terrae]|uniref:ABC transporter ATP-binding protein n=1 Tax=Janibacter TaxID=53457 RepID=UPI001C3F1BD1|nr:ABC transporter ATP-binding protein [Janibacter terrae]
MLIIADALVEMSDVSRHFSTQVETVRAVDEVSFSARTGEFVCLFGASGSGKSTLLNLIAGLDRPTSGQIRVAGADVSDASNNELASLRLRHVGVVFQHDNLIEELTVSENVSFPLDLRGDTVPKDRAAEVEMWLERVGMGGYGERFPRELSGGQQQRVGVARALVGERDVLVADEPTGALDSANSAALFDLLADLSAQGQTVILSSHDAVARASASRVLEMVDGRLIDG